MLANAKGDGPCRKMCIANFISCWKACTRATRAVIYKQQLYALVLQTAVHWTPYEPYGVVWRAAKDRRGSRERTYQTSRMRWREGVPAYTIYIAGQKHTGSQEF